jgi:hypothetical protein
MWRAQAPGVRDVGWTIFALFVGTLVGAAGALAAALFVPRRYWETFAQAFVVAFIGCLVLGALDALGVVFSTRFLLSSTELTRQAERAMAATGGKDQTDPCATPVGPLDSFGTPAEVCAVPGSVNFAFADDLRGAYTQYRGLLYQPGQQGTPRDICERGLGGGWWEYTSITFPDCPPGFGFRGAP